MFKVPEQYRFKQEGHPYSSDKSIGDNGAFVIPHPSIRNYWILVIASSALKWEHVSASLFKKARLQKQQNVERTMTWQEMCYVKDMFWDENDTVLQYHPAKKDYVNRHPFTLHLWRPQGRFPKPPKIFV